MTIYIAFLRGINVGGKNIIKMSDLKCLFESLKYINVETYIQSGNVIFESDQNENIIRKSIESEIEKIFGFSVSVILRSVDELENLVKSLPFSNAEVKAAEAQNSEGESLYISMMTQESSHDKIIALSKYESDSDRFKNVSRNIYLLLRHSIRNSKLAGKVANLDDSATFRNWKTIEKIYSIVKSRIEMKE
ncbi:MAG: DUF1697 domain-containing protein [Saccharofermentanales bacterium]